MTLTIAVDGLSFVIGKFCNCEISCGAIVDEGVAMEYSEIALLLKWNRSDEEGEQDNNNNNNTGSLLPLSVSDRGGPQS